MTMSAEPQVSAAELMRVAPAFLKASSVIAEPRPAPGLDQNFMPVLDQLMYAGRGDGDARFLALDLLGKAPDFHDLPSKFDAPRPCGAHDEKRAEKNIAKKDPGPLW